VQLNGLIRQVVNFNNNTTTTPVNPYLLTYTINSVETGLGLRLGAGANFSSSTVKDGITETITSINDFQLRLGLEKRFELSKRWSAGIGLDALANGSNDYTTATIHSFDTTTTKTISKLPAYGGGAMGWLRVRVTEKILIGTEASFYYLAGTEERELAVTKKVMSSTPPFTMVTTTTVTKSKPKFSQGTFQSPIVFYLVVNM
jgi:hypothetical protein